MQSYAKLDDEEDDELKLSATLLVQHALRMNPSGYLAQQHDEDLEYQLEEVWGSN